MHRLLYDSRGAAAWISHLDMMRGFQRCFARAGVRVRYTEGFNPHAYLSLALPLPVGTESCCEIADFELTDPSVSLTALPSLLNACFPAGIHVRAAYASERKIKELTHLRARIALTYDAPAPDGCAEAIRALLARDTLTVLKKRKKGERAPEDIRPMIVSADTEMADAHTAVIEAVVCAQNPTLNPMYLAEAVRTCLPRYAPDAVSVCREEVLDAAGKVVR